MGGVNFLLSFYDLLQEAAKDKENRYFHFLSGQDILVRPLSLLYDYFDKHDGTNFLEYGENLITDRSKGYLIGLNRSQYYHLFDLLNYRSNSLHRQIEKQFVKLQQGFHVKRHWPFPNYYKGSCWCSISKDAADEIVHWIGRNKKTIGYTFAPDEVILQSILLNSPKKYKVVNNNLRFVLWDAEEEIGSPTILNENHFGMIKESECFFARKVDPEKSKLLIEQIEKFIKTEVL